MTPSRRPARFDTALLALVLALVLALAAITLRGDQVGVTVVESGTGPRGSVSGITPITFTFSESMQPDTVAARLLLDPAVPGVLSWSPDGRVLTFFPARALPPDTAITVRLEAGARSAAGRTLRESYRWNFAIQPLRVAGLAPADAAYYDLWRFDPVSLETAPLTASPQGIEEYAISPTGQQIAYSQRADDGTLDLWLLDLVTGHTRPITHCVEAICTRPAWNPEGTQIAYERREFIPGQAGGLTPARAWVVDLATLDTRLLLEDPALLGQHPTWSPDGRWIALYDASLPGIRIIERSSGAVRTIASHQDIVGVFSPDGDRLAYPMLVNSPRNPQLFTQLNVFNLTTGEYTWLGSGDEVIFEDSAAAWSPDGSVLLVARQYFDTRYTPGKQLFLLDPQTGEAQALIVDADYTHSAPQWDSTGQRVLFQRYRLNTPGALPELWTYDRATETLQRVAENAFFPAWLP